MWITVIHEILQLLNRYDNDTRGFCQWAYARPLGFYFACS